MCIRDSIWRLAFSTTNFPSTQDISCSMAPSRAGCEFRTRPFATPSTAVVIHCDVSGARGAFPGGIFVVGLEAGKSRAGAAFAGDLAAGSAEDFADGGDCLLYTSLQKKGAACPAVAPNTYSITPNNNTDSRVTSARSVPVRHAASAALSLGSSGNFSSAGSMRRVRIWKDVR